MSNLENPRKWRFTWEAQSHSPILRLFLFDSQTKASLQCKNLKVQLNLSQSQLLVSWLEEEGKEEVSVRVPIPRVLIDSESPVSFRALDDHIEVKLVLLLPVDHPIVSSFDSVLNSSENGDDAIELDAAKPLVMDTDLKSLASMEEGVHFYCRNCSTRLTKSPLRNFMEMPSIDWREVADNWFGACCCSFGGVSEKLVTRFANSYTCAKGMCLVNFTTVLLCKDDLVACKLYNGTQEYLPGPDFASDYALSEDMLTSQERTNDLCEKFSSIHIKNDSVTTNVLVTTEEANGLEIFSALPVSNISETETSVPGCCVHTADHIRNHVDEGSQHDASETSVDQNASKLLPNQKFFLNGFLGNAFMAKSYNLSMDIEWMEFVCPNCLSLLGAYPFDNGGAHIDGGVRLFKCYISTCSSAGGSGDLFRKYSLERMFTNQLLENAKDELSFRTLVRDLKTKSPLLQIVLLNPNSWCCSGYCLDTASATESSLKLDLLPVIKVLFSDCRETTASQLRVCEDWITRNLADVVCMFARQVDELIQSLASAKDRLPPSDNFLQGLHLSSLQQ